MDEIEQAPAAEDGAVDEALARDTASDAPGDIEDLAEVEIEGRRHLIPRALKGGFLMQADYTRKTQVLAAERAALEAERAALRAQDGPGPGEDVAAALDDEARAYEAVDWEGLARADPDGARAAWDQYAQVSAAREALAAQALHQHQAVLEAGHAELARDVPGWSPQLAGEMGRYAVEQLGFTPDEVESCADPRLVKLLHRAFSGALGEARAARVRAGQMTQPAPTLRGGGGFAAAGDSDDFAAFERMADARLKAR